MNFKPQCNTQAELFREAARVSEMCEGTNINVWDCIKVGGNIYGRMVLSEDYSIYEFALAIIEGKPVFRGDELYIAGNGYVTIIGINSEYLLYKTLFFTGRALKVCFSRLPPKPKTVMVELSLGCIKRRAGNEEYCSITDAGEITLACQKAIAKLEGAE